jgi:hypothetical protein
MVGFKIDLSEDNLMLGGLLDELMCLWLIIWI